MRRPIAQLAVVVAAVVVAGCGKHYLNQYEFAGRTLALVYVEPPAPELLGSWFDVDVGESAIQTVVRAGATAAKEVEARRARARFDSAVTRVNIEERLAQRTLDRASRYLGTRTVATPEGADFVLEVQMKAFGIDARSSRATYLYSRAEAVLLDRRTGREIWSDEVKGSDRLTAYVIGTPGVPSAIFSAATLHNVTVADFQAALEQLTNNTSDRVTNELRDKLRDVRDR